ncbi:restriction endonuclease subunit S [Vibrio aestuarianus]|uniref:Type I restriction-modification system, specificity subunit S n=1 Tax=Vibrio aestuarianus TaxID=28171 RepID=A0ABM9FM21_9VIBR|nr:restriction endonuclease subunit S [Vibrio aestuarianus]MDE1228573.1 restriction endonuclease subunit S [Vibrio aestuarianus]MDE1255139.1 restriction endonuclease subunit S [Vibrio aestuarianus]MDH5901326.1 restriction endonuclease subunit S [Vibrio aestuarianus]MDH5956269.1 restriction endonuclease subunit S [Vibrio aestuarianus]MDH5982795.1 restriction endonuclease subunit S [Vibrio aestuarianus]
MVPNQISKLDLIQARIDVIPSDWKLCKVAEALNIRNNLRKPISQEVRETIKGDYPYYGPTRVQGYISEYEQDGTYALIGEDGDHFLKYATMPQTQYISGKCTVNNHAHILESSEICDAQWFFNYFKHRDITNFLSRQGAGRFKLNKATLEKLPMLVPPLPEQCKIAKILSTWDKAIATTEKLIEASKQQKKSLMQQLLTGKKRLVNPETGKAFEGEWERHSMSDLVFIDRKSLGKKTPDDFEFQYISLSDVAVGSISNELEVHKFASAPSRARRVIQEGDILLSTVRPNLKGFAKVSGKHADCIASTGFSVLTPKKRVSGDYIYQYIFSSHVTGQIDSLVVGSNYPAINSSDVAGLKVYCPTYEEQQKIASALTTADKEIEVLEAKLADFKQEKKALMQQLLTGKRRVKIEHMEQAIC